MPHFEIVGQDQPALDLSTTRRAGSATYAIALPFLPESKNKALNWKPEWHQSAMGKWRRHLKLRLEELGVPLGNQRVGLAARLIFGQDPRRPVPRRDPQNYAHTLWHWVPDALVRLGYLVDDDHGRIQWPGNLGLELAIDVRAGIDPRKLDRTILSISVPVVMPEGEPTP